MHQLLPAVCVHVMRCKGQFVLSMAGRGFDSHIIKGMNTTFNESDCVSCGACAQACPTSAISDVFESKSVVPQEKVRTVCTYCGVGCNLDVAVADNKVKSIQAPFDADVNEGHTCLKGRYAFSFLRSSWPPAWTDDQKEWQVRRSKLGRSIWLFASRFTEIKKLTDRIT